MVPKASAAFGALYAVPMPATGRALRQAIDGLAAPDRDVAWLYLVQRWSLSDIAKQLQMEYVEVVAALGRAREALRGRVRPSTAERVARVPAAT
jgi:DNA-directed RNA polymerase specialized sigma24 family protein